MAVYQDLGDGIHHYTGYLSLGSQENLACTIMELADGLWLSPHTPGGQPFSVRQVNLGPLGWISDAKGYRYAAQHPEKAQDWPAMPELLSTLWADLLPEALPAECALINHYEGKAKMGLHRDADEQDLETPILSISLGDPARFRIGGPSRKGPTRSLILSSGDILILSGPSRRFYHGIDRLLPADELFAPSLPFTGRLNITMRRVTKG